MKKLALILFAIFINIAAYSAFLKNVPVDLKQPDGTIIHCFITGDEFHRRVHDKDNYTIIQNPQTGYYVYTLVNNEELVPSENVVGKIDPSKISIDPNIAFISDLTKIRWIHFVYAPKNKGTVCSYEEGLYYYNGVWRSEYQSIMGYQIGYNYFNAPSREAIVKQIKIQAGENYSFEDFVANDKIEILIDYNNNSATIAGKDRKHYPPRVIFTNE